MSMYLPKRLELSLRNVLALPKACWGGERRGNGWKGGRRGGSSVKQSLQCCTVAEITGHGVHSHTYTHLEIIWQRHVRHQNKRFSQVLHLSESFNLQNSETDSKLSCAGCTIFPLLSSYIFQINE